MIINFLIIIQEIMDNLLEVKNLSFSFFENGVEQKILKNISFNVGKKEIVGIVGESGSGKSMTALSIMRLCRKMHRLQMENYCLKARIC